MKKTVLTIVSCMLLSGLVAYFVADGRESGKSQIVTEYLADGSAVTIHPVNLSVDDYPDFTYAAENAVEAVVFVKVTIKTSSPYQMNDPLFRFFFGDGFQQGDREQQGSGSGVIIRSDGYIVTNNHVVQDASTIEVTLNNNKTYAATVVGTDAATDVALLKIEAAGLPTIEIADSDKLRLGEWVLAIGSPLGEELRSTITAGIVSAKGRSMPNYTGEFKIESFIQTDAAVNPGNSGGALVNKAGQLVGINTAIVSTTGSYSGYSFAVPSNIVKKIVGDLIDYGSVKRVKLGVTISAVTEKIEQEMKLSSLDGVYINEVGKGTAAEKAGLLKGDVILSVDSVKVKTPSALQEKINAYHPGDKAVLGIVRDGKSRNVTVKFEEESVMNGTVSEDGSVLFYGARLAPAEGGVMIVSAGDGKIAAAGGQDGYLIKYVNDQKVSTPEDVVALAKKAKRSIFMEGISSTGRPFYFGFGKNE